MLCDDCKERQATVHLTKIYNNEKVEKHLCEQCAQKSGELGFAADNKYFMQDLLKGLFSQGFGNISHNNSREACPNCGMAYSDFSRYGKIGCSECFSSYADRLEPLLRRIHGNNTHTGKVPKRMGGKIAVKQNLRKLRQELVSLIGREDYEQAAKVRDEIKALEKELSE